MAEIFAKKGNRRVGTNPLPIARYAEVHMDPQLVRERKAGYEVVNRLVLEEKRRRTPAERLHLAQTLANDLARMVPRQ